MAGYQVPKGIPLGEVPAEAFEGEPGEAPLEGLPGSVFFSPALLDESTGSSIDLAEVSVKAFASDAYSMPQTSQSRVFLFGPNSASRTNEPLYRTQPAEYSAVAVMVQTIPPGPTTVIKVP